MKKNILMSQWLKKNMKILHAPTQIRIRHFSTRTEKLDVVIKLSPNQELLPGMVL